MKTYLFFRLLALPVLLLLVTFTLFVLILQLPLEVRAEIYLPSGNPHKTAEQAQKVFEEIVRRNGLDQPLLIQYGKWLGNLSKGDLGFSPTWRQPVLEGFLQRAPATLELALFALIPAILLALSLGGVAARHQGKYPDIIIQFAAFLGWSLPSFIIGLVFLKFFYGRLGIFSAERLSDWAVEIVKSDNFVKVSGLYTVDAILNGQWRIFLDALWHLILPSTALGVMQWSLMMRIMRSSILDTLNQEYIVTARSKGVAERKVINLHARKNAILPVISTAGAAVASLINGIVVIEVIFNFNGLGYWAANALLNYDIPVSIAFTLFACCVVVITSLAADLLYAWIDPRVRLE